MTWRKVRGNPYLFLCIFGIMDTRNEWRQE